MSVTVDHELVEVEAIGLRTVGQVLAHVQRRDRLVVNLLLDGRRPDLDRLSELKSSLLRGHTIFIETAEPREMSMEVLDAVAQQLQEADRLKSEAVDLLYRNQPAPALERLSGCFSVWHAAQETMHKVAQLLHLDLDEVRVDMQSLKDVLNDFAEQLRQIKNALEDRDFVTLSDILAYETTQTSAHWHMALEAVREMIVASC